MNLVPRGYWLWGGFVAAWAFALWSYNVDDLTLSLRFLTFQVRDLHRAQELLKGRWIFFGPEATGGGNLPGPFYYVILASALAWAREWLHAYYLLIGLSVTAAAIGWAYISVRVSVFAGLLWLGLFILSAPLQNYMMVFLNVSYMVFFIVMSLIFTLEAFGPKGLRHRERALMMATFLVGLALQLHFSSVVLLAAFVTLYFWSPRWGYPRLPIQALIKATIAFLVPLMPYMIWWGLSRMGRNIGQAAPFAGEGVNALPSLWAFLDIPSWDRLDHGMDFLANALPLPLLVMVAALLFHRLFLARPNPEVGGPDARVLAVCMAFTFIPAAYVFFAPIGYRYSQSFTLSALFFTVIVLGRYLHGKVLSLYSLFTLLTILGLMLSSFVDYGTWEVDAILGSRHALTALGIVAALVLCYRAGEWRRALLAGSLTMALAVIQNPSLWAGSLANHEMAIPSFAGWRNVAGELCTRHGWGAREMMERIYTINMHMEVDPRPIFRKVEKVCPKGASPREADGYFVTFWGYFLEQPFQEWMLKQPISGEVRRNIENGNIELGKAEKVMSLALVPYRILDKSAVTTRIHNIGLGYQLGDSAALASRHRPDGFTRGKDGSYLLTWNECPGNEIYCLVGARVRVERFGARTRLSVEIVGDSLAQNSPWITPNWTMAWIKPYLEARCGGTIYRFEIADAIGYERQNSYPSPGYDFYLANHSTIAPVRRHFELGCKVEEFTIGREAGMVEQIYGQISLPPQRRSVAL